MKKISKLAVMLIFTITVLSGCSKQDDVITNGPRETMITGSVSQKTRMSYYKLYVPKDNSVTFRVEYPGFIALNKTFEEFKSEALKVEKAGSPRTDETLYEYYKSNLNADNQWYLMGFDGPPSSQELEQKSTNSTSNAKVSAAPIVKLIAGVVPHYYEWDASENPSHYNWCGHAALKSVASYHGSLKTLGQIHTAFSNNSTAYTNGGKGVCNDYKYCARMTDMLWMANKQNGGSWNYNFPTSSTVTKSTIASFFQQLRDGVDYAKPVIVASNYLEPYGHFYPVVGYSLVTNSAGAVDYNASLVYLRNVQYSSPSNLSYENSTTVQNFFDMKRSADLLVVRPWYIS